MANKSRSGNGDSTKRRARLSQTDVPAHAIRDALRVARVIKDEYAMQPATPIDVGRALGIKPTSGGFRSVTGAAVAYGLTTGAYNAAEIGLTDLGRRAVAPTDEGDDLAALREAFQRPRVLKEFLAKYRGNRFPRPDIANNVLIGMGVPPESAGRVQNLIREGALELGLLTEIRGDHFFNTQPSAALTPTAERVPADAAVPGSGEDADEPGFEPKEALGAARNDEVDRSDQKVVRPSAIFLGHGKNRKPLEQLIRVLDEWGIPHKEAVAEPNAGRPIPQKVAETMRACGAAILIFTADEELRDANGDPLWRPSENVIHELGAAGVLYDNRIIIFKEEGVTLASNFSSIGYISFEKDKLDATVFELLRELRHFEIISIQVATA